MRNFVLRLLLNSLVLGSVMAGWFRVFVVPGCVPSGFVVAGLAAVGFEALGSATSNSEAVWFKQHQIHHTNAAESTSFTTTPEHNAAEPMWEKLWVCRVPRLRQTQQSTILITIIKCLKFPS